MQKKIALSFPCLGFWAGLLLLMGCNGGTFNYLSATRSADEIRQTEQRIERVYYAFLGHFVNQSQADTAHSKLYQAQEVISVPIWRKHKGEYWFYMGRFKNNFVESPITEAIYKIWRIDVDTLGLQYFELPSEWKGTHQWREETPFKDLSPGDLHPSRDCVSFIVKKDDHTHVVLPNSYPCPSSLSFQIHYFDFGGQISPDILWFYGTYYNENLEPVVQYLPHRALIFERLDKSQPKY